MKRINLYLVPFVISFLVCDLIAWLSFGFPTKFCLYIFAIAPIAMFVLVLVFTKSTFNNILTVIAYVVLAASSLLFWSANEYSSFASVDGSSIFPLAFLIFNIFCVVSFAPYKSKREFGINGTTNFPVEVREKAHNNGSIILCFNILPLLLLVFYLNGNTRSLLSVLIFCGGMIVMSIYAFSIGGRAIKEKQVQEQKELEEEIKREQGYR